MRAGCTPSANSAVELRIQGLLSAYPAMPATVIAERDGRTGLIYWFRERVPAIRPEYLPADLVDRLEHPPGRVVQCDLWFPPQRGVGFRQLRVCRAFQSDPLTSVSNPSGPTLLETGHQRRFSGRVLLLTLRGNHLHRQHNSSR